MMVSKRFFNFYFIFMQWMRLSGAIPTSKRSLAQNCTPENTSIRREWGDLSNFERKSYTDAINCLQTKPSKLDQIKYPAALNAFLDFGATHVDQSLIIHLSGFFLPWHRHFVYLFEKALHDECGYNGTQPYWDWPRWANNLYSSPLFDGSEYSLSGDGAAIDTGPILHGSNLILPSGNGGGCVTTGPFKNTISSLGPFTNITVTLTGMIPADAFVPNVRCLTRNLNPYLATIYSNQDVVDDLLNSTSISEFQNKLSSSPFSDRLGPHDAGHFTLGGIGGDVFASPQDPAFFVHHAQVDRMWTLWQAADTGERQFAVSGTLTFMNIPPSPNITLEDMANFLSLSEEQPVGNLMSTTAGPYCYTYA